MPEYTVLIESLNTLPETYSQENAVRLKEIITQHQTRNPEESLIGICFVIFRHLLITRNNCSKEYFQDLLQLAPQIVHGKDEYGRSLILLAMAANRVDVQEELILHQSPYDPLWLSKSKQRLRLCRNELRDLTKHEFLSLDLAFALDYTLETIYARTPIPFEYVLEPEELMQYIRLRLKARDQRGMNKRCTMPNTIRAAVLSDVPAINSLVNSAYRGESSKKGWATEADLLGGQRCDEEEIAEIINDKDQRILLCFQEDRLIGTVNIHRKKDKAYLGMLCVQPDLQAAGIGKQILAQAEEYIAQQWQLPKIEMTVIKQRTALIEWYKRRGFVATGETRPFPYGDERFGIPKINDLEFIVLEKTLMQHKLLFAYSDVMRPYIVAAAAVGIAAVAVACAWQRPSLR